ncbi:MAG: helicase RepA family protein [Clostridiales bacterium]|nr:helicase RepA family protein [Clostridiales bacterium]
MVNKNADSKKTEHNFNVISCDELLDSTLVQSGVIVEGLLKNGVYLLAGAPKVGKSFFSMQLAYSIASGKPFLTYDVHGGTVLYLALEDDYSRLQQRVANMFGVEFGYQGNLFFATDAGTIGGSFLAQMEDFIKSHPGTKLIIIDTLQRIKDIQGASYSYSRDYEFMADLKAISDRHHVCMLVVHHTRKQEARDIFNMISGTNGLLGAADGALVISKEKRTANVAFVDIVGRDQPDQKLTIEFDRANLTWSLRKSELELWKSEPDPLLDAIAAMLTDDRREWRGTATELLELLPKDFSIQPNVLTRRLNVKARQLYDDYGIQYQTKRGHEREVSLKRIAPDTPDCVDCDGRDDT